MIGFPKTQLYYILILHSDRNILSIIILMKLTEKNSISDILKFFSDSEVEFYII